MEDAAQWAIREFGAVELGDRRLRRRAMVIAAAMQRRPGDSLPQQMGSWAQTKAAYRFFDNANVDYETISRPHWEQTRQVAGHSGSVVLMVQDITDINYSSKIATQGLGPIGRSDQGQGLMVHNTLAIVPTTQQVLGLAYQQVWIRDRVKRKGQESKAERLARTDRQSTRWERAVTVIGPPPPGVQWVHVGDCEADNFTLLETVRMWACDFVFRLGHNRRLAEWTPEQGHWVLTDTRQLTPQIRQSRTLIPQRGRPARDVEFGITWAAMTLRSPKAEPQQRTFAGTVIRCWDLSPPSGEDPLDWILFTTVPVPDEAAALQCLDWYACRWIIEEYHACLKTGCAVEASHLRHHDRLLRRFAFVAIVAVSLLQLRHSARQSPAQPAAEVVDPFLVQLIHRYDPTLNLNMSVHDFWQAVARLGGYLARNRDPDPGWKSLWHGWLRLQDWAEGARFFLNSPPL